MTELSIVWGQLTSSSMPAFSLLISRFRWRRRKHVHSPHFSRARFPIWCWPNGRLPILAFILFVNRPASVSKSHTNRFIFYRIQISDMFFFRHFFSADLPQLKRPSDYWCVSYSAPNLHNVQVIFTYRIDDVEFCRMKPSHAGLYQLDVLKSSWDRFLVRNSGKYTYYINFTFIFVRLALLITLGR